MGSWTETDSQEACAYAMHALLRGAGHNLRMILAHQRVLYCVLDTRIAMAMMLLASATSARHASLRN